MIVSLKKRQKHFKFTIQLERDSPIKGIGQGQAEIELLHRNFSFDFPFEINEPHPDLLALTILAVVQPWINKTISFPKPVSPHFAETITAVFGFQVDGVDQELQSRKKGTRDALSFSGGVDSLAVAHVLPADNVKLAFIRKKHNELPDIHPNYSTHATEKIVEKVINGYAIQSDLEHIVGPYPQYPTWVALSTQCFLLADHLNLKSISYGTIMGASYLPAGTKYRKIDVPDRGWKALFASAGIDLTKPVAGLTEVGTAIIVKNSEYNEIASSCQFGTFLKPCMKCVKCFRKYCIGIALNEEKPSKAILDNFWQQNGIKNYMVGIAPLHQQHILMFAFSRMTRSDLPHPFRLLYDKVMICCNNNLDWCSLSYPIALKAYIPDPAFRATIKTNIEEIIPSMDGMDINIVETWDLTGHSMNYRGKIKDIDKAITLLWDKQSIENKGTPFELENQKLKAQIIRAQISMVETEKELGQIKDSIRYQVGEELAKTISSPLRVIKLPLRLVKIYSSRKRPLHK